MKYAFFVANATKLGALKLQGNIISNNIEYVISKSEFLMVDAAYLFVHVA